MVKILVTNLSFGAKGAIHKRRLVPLWKELIGEVGPDLVLAQEAGRALPLGGDLGARMRALGTFDLASGAYDYLGQLVDSLSPDFQAVFSPAILDHPAKLKNMGLSSSVAWGQGCAVLVSQRHDVQPLGLWNALPLPAFGAGEISLPLQPGDSFYQGTRNTEQRTAQLLRLRCGERQSDGDLLLANVHLTTLSGEREGKPAIDRAGRTLRRRQFLEVHAAMDALEKGSPVNGILIAGDFNEVPAVVSKWDRSFTALVTGPTREAPKISVDNALLRGSWKPHSVRILAGSSETRDHPQLDKGLSSLLDELLKHGVDHYPFVTDIGP